jgi:hypothetical protein
MFAPVLQNFLIHEPNFFKGFMARCHSFFYIFYYINSFLHIHSINLSVALAELHSIFLIAVRSEEGLHWGAEPRIELGAALQQPDALTSEPRRTLGAAPHPSEPRRTRRIQDFFFI